MLDPLLQIAGVEGAHISPRALGPFGGGPFIFAGPVVRRDEYERDPGSLFLRCGLSTFVIVFIGLGTRFFIDAEFPTGCAFRNLGRRRVGFDHPVPARALGVVVTREIDPPQFPTGGMDEFAQEDGQPAARVDIAVRPIPDVPGLDGEKGRRVGGGAPGPVRSFLHGGVPGDVADRYA